MNEQKLTHATLYLDPNRGFIEIRVAYLEDDWLKDHADEIVASSDHFTPSNRDTKGGETHYFLTAREVLNMINVERVGLENLGDLVEYEKDMGAWFWIRPEPKLPDRLEPIENYLHRDWEIEGRDGVGADGWSIATVYDGIATDGIGMKEMFKGNRSLIKNAARTYEAMIALYNQYIDTYEDFDPDELEVLQSVASLASDIQAEGE